MGKKNLKEEINLDKIIEEEADTSQNEQSQEEDLESQEEKLKKLADENLDKYQRTLAEFDNFRKRTQKEKAAIYDDAVKETIEKLLPVIDNFERAVASQESTNDNFYKGIELILKQIKAFLEELGIEVIESVGQPFDTNFHFAVAHVDDEAFGANEVIEEMQKGYKYKDKIIRYSMVKVAN